MNVPKTEVQKQSIQLSMEERLWLIHTLNELPLSQFIELEYALEIPSGIMPPVQAKQGLKSRALLEWVKGPTGPGLQALLNVLETAFNLSINQKYNRNSKNSEEKGLLAFAISGSIDEMDEPKLRAITALLKNVSKDVSLEIVDMKRGSIRFRVLGTPEGLDRLKTLIESGSLSEVMGETIENVRSIEIPRTILNKLNLRSADLKGADFRWANLSGANLREANLREANLIGVNLSGANLFGANLRRARLNRADLSGAILTDAQLSEAHLREVDLSGASLARADLTNTIMTASKGLSEGDIGDFIARGAIFGDSSEDHSFNYSSPRVPR